MATLLNEISRQSSTRCSYLGCANHPQIQLKLSFFSFPKNNWMIRKWMHRMNLEYVKPLSGCVCADHFYEDDIIVSDDGRKLLRDGALPIVYEYNMDKCSYDVPSLRMRLLRLTDRPLSSDSNTLTCSFCDTAVAGNFLDLRKNDQPTLQARRIIWLHFGIDALDIELNVRCICQICWTITNNFRTLHNKIKNVSPTSNSRNDIDERSNGNAVANPDDNADQTDANEWNHPIEFSDVRQTVDSNPELASTSSTNDIIVRGKRNNSDNDVPCLHCDRIYSNNSTLLRHMRLNHGIFNVHPCTKCKLSFASIPLLAAHNRSKHRNSFNRGLQSRKIVAPFPGSTSPSCEPTEFCTDCGSEFENVQMLKHYLIRAHSKSIACDECGEMFANADKFRLHVGHHLKAVTHTCSECGKEFRKESKLREHEALHTGEFLYNCDVCQKPFRRHTQYMTHRRKDHPSADYNTASNFICKYCDTRFQTKSGLENHLHHCKGKVFCAELPSNDELQPNDSDS